MATNHLFIASMRKSALSLPSQVMEELDLNRVVFFVVKSATNAQSEQLCRGIKGDLLKRIPLKKAKREMFICRTADDLNDAALFDFYETIMQQIFGTKARIRVRILRRIAR